MSSTLGKIKKGILKVLWIEEKPNKQSIMIACPIDSQKVTTRENDRTSIIPKETEVPNIPFVFSHGRRNIGFGNIELHQKYDWLDILLSFKF